MIYLLEYYLGKGHGWAIWATHDTRKAALEEREMHISRISGPNLTREFLETKVRVRGKRGIV